jgi:hypothetical protein
MSPTYTVPPGCTVTIEVDDDGDLVGVTVENLQTDAQKALRRVLGWEDE